MHHHPKSSCVDTQRPLPAIIHNRICPRPTVFCAVDRIYTRDYNRLHPFLGLCTIFKLTFSGEEALLLLLLLRQGRREVPVHIVIVSGRQKRLRIRLETLMQLIKSSASSSSSCFFNILETKKKRKRKKAKLSFVRSI